MLRLLRRFVSIAGNVVASRETVLFAVRQQERVSYGASAVTGREEIMAKMKDVEQRVERLVLAAMQSRQLVAQIADPASRLVAERVTDRLLERNLEAALGSLFKQ